MSNKLSGKDIFLLLLYVPGITGSLNEPIEGRTRITKAMYIFEKEIYKPFKFNEILDADKLPQFFAYHYGPFSKDVYTDIEFFKNIGFVYETPVGDAPTAEVKELEWWQDDAGINEANEGVVQEADNTLYKFCLTEQGKLFANNELRKNISDNQYDILTSFKSKINSLPLDALLSYVYKKYPEDTEKSLIKEKILRG